MKVKAAQAAALLILLLFAQRSAYADAEFYGIQMRNERVAKSLVLAEGQLSAEEIRAGSLFDKSVYATASLKEDDAQRLIFTMQVFNNSPKVIPADYSFRDYYIVTRDGRKYPLLDPESQSDLDEIASKSNVRFQPSLGNLVLAKKNIQMIVCSFDLGRTTLVLFPSAKRELIEKMTAPPIPPEPEKVDEKGRFLFAKRHGSDQKLKQGPKKDKVAEPTRANKTAPQKGQAWVNPETDQAFAWPKDKPTAVTQAASAKQNETEARLDKAIKGFVYVPAKGAEEVSKAVSRIVEPNAGRAPKPSYPAGKSSFKTAEGQAFEYTEAPRTDAQVLQYNPDHRFVTLNVGTKDGLKKNMLVYIMRSGQTVAQARIKQIRDHVAAASVIPDSVISQVQPGDKISLA